MLRRIFFSPLPYSLLPFSPVAVSPTQPLLSRPPSPPPAPRAPPPHGPLWSQGDQTCCGRKAAHLFPLQQQRTMLLLLSFLPSPFLSSSISFLLFHFTSLFSTSTISSHLTHFLLKSTHFPVINLNCHQRFEEQGETVDGAGWGRRGWVGKTATGAGLGEGDGNGGEGERGEEDATWHPRGCQLLTGQNIPRIFCTVSNQGLGVNRDQTLGTNGCTLQMLETSDVRKNIGE